MKLFLLVALMVFSFNSFAEDKVTNFALVKEKVLKHIDERISSLQENKSCVSAAQNHQDLKACRKKMQEMRRAMKEKRNEKKPKRNKG